MAERVQDFLGSTKLMESLSINEVAHEGGLNRENDTAKTYRNKTPTLVCLWTN